MKKNNKKSWIIQVNCKFYESKECKYWQKSDNYCHHPEVNGKCCKEKCPFKV